jgi:hypothetical protein
MDLKTQAFQKLKQCDLINDEISSLKIKEQTIRGEISQIKKQIENENNHLIGKKALCSILSVPTFQNLECVCSAVKCNELFEIQPLFTRMGKKVSIDFYNWL